MKPLMEVFRTKKFIEITDALPSLTMSYGMLKCPVDSSSTEPGSLISPPLQNNNKYRFYLALFYKIITPTSGSFVLSLATDNGCYSSETCFVNLKLCASTSNTDIYMYLLC